MCASLTNSSHGSRKCSRQRCGATTWEHVTITRLLLLLPALGADGDGDGGGAGACRQKAVPRLSGSNSVMPYIVVNC